MLAEVRFVDADRNATVWPSALIEGLMLLPLEGSGKAPPGRLTRTELAEQALPVAMPRHVLRTKMFSTPGVTFGPRFDPKVA